MPSISIRLSETLVAALCAADRPVAAVSSVARQAIATVLSHGPKITHAPIAVPCGEPCAMSAWGGRAGIAVEIDGPGTALPGRGVVRHRDPVRRPRR